MSDYDRTAAEAEARDAAGLDRLRSEYAPMLLRTTAARMQMRIDAILERDGDQKVAIEGRGCGISFLFCRDIVHALEAGHDEIERLQRAIAAADAAADTEMERVKACEHIACGDEGWERVRNICPSTAAVAALRDAFDQLRGELLVAKATTTRTGEMLDKALATLRNKHRDPCPEASVVLCDDCPPTGYPTDDTRCEECPRRS